MEFDLRRKARLVAEGHLTAPVYKDAPHAGIASIMSIKTCIFVSELNDLLLLVSDAGNAYFEAFISKKLYIKFLNCLVNFN